MGGSAVSEGGLPLLYISGITHKKSRSPLSVVDVHALHSVVLVRTVAAACLHCASECCPMAPLRRVSWLYNESSKRPQVTRQCNLEHGQRQSVRLRCSKKGSPYSITERRVPELNPVLGSQPAGDVSHKPGGMLPLLSARPAVTPATLKRAATNFAAW